MVPPPPLCPQGSVGQHWAAGVALFTVLVLQGHPKVSISKEFELAAFLKKEPNG